MVTTELISSEFLNQFNNGETFSLNLSDTTPNLVGNVGDRIKTIQQVAVSWTSQSNGTYPFTIITGNSLERLSGNFFSDGFVTGDIISLYDNFGAAWVFEDRNIVSMTSTTITFDGAAVPLASFPNGRMFGKTPLTSIRFKFGLIENNEPTNYISKIDGTAENSFTSNNITGAHTPMIAASGVESWKEDNQSVTIRSVSMQGRLEDYKQIFEIIHEFSILPYYQQGESTNLATLVPPPLFNSTNSLKYVYSGEFSVNLSNPTGSKTTVVDGVLGSVGYYNESLNGNPNFYSISNISYTNTTTGAPEIAINAQEKTTVKFDLNSVNSTFNANTNVVVGVSMLPLAADYQQNANTIDENFLLDRAFTTVDSVAVASSIISEFVATKISTDLIEIEFDADYIIAIEEQLENQAYVIWCATTDSTLSAINTDRVALKVDVQKYTFDPDVKDLIWIDKVFHFPHNVNDTVNAASFDDYKGWIEDGFTIKVPFEVNNELNAKIETLKVHFSAYNPSTDNIFNLQSYSFTLSSGILVPSFLYNPYQAINIINERNYQLVSGSQFNKANVTSLGFANRGGIDVYQYEMIIGFKANFEEWIAQLDADTIFYDANEPNDGLNKKSSRYSLVNGYELIMVIEADVRKGNGVLTNYKFLTQPHEYYDYDLDNNVTPEWSVDIITLDEDGVNTSGVLKTSDISTIRATFTPLDGTTSLSNPYAIIRLNQSGGNVNTINELSSIRESIVGNPLIPLDGESYTKITDNGSIVVVECRVDGSLIDASLNYEISATLRDDANEVGLETELGVLFETENNDIIIIE